MATTVESLSKAIGKKKQSMAFAWLADLMRQRGDLDGALKCVESGLAAFPESLEGKLVLSKILEEKQDYDGVVGTLDFVLIRNSYCLSALRRMGDAYAAKGDEEKRNHYYQLLHDLDPLDAFWKDEYAPKMEESAEVELSMTSVAASAAVVEPSLDDLLKNEPLNLPIKESATEKATPATPEEALLEEPLIEKVSDDPGASVDEDDPFASFANLAPTDEDADGEVSFNDLEHSLDDAIAGFAPTNTEKDVFPTDEIEGNDISSALSGIFGAAETEEKSEETERPAAEISMEPDTAPLGSATENLSEKTQTLSDAFDDIFGEDELPEEFIPMNKVPAATSVTDSMTEESNVESVAAVPAGSELSIDEQKLSEDDSFAPLENLDLNKTPAQESSTEKKTETPELDTVELDKSVDSSFDNLFGKNGDDELKEGVTDTSNPFEKPSESFGHSSESSLEMGTIVDLDLDEKSKASTPDVPAQESSTEEKPETPELDTVELDKSVDSSFDNLFGKNGDDELKEGVTDTSSPFEKSSESFGHSSESSLEMGTIVDLDLDEKSKASTPDVPAQEPSTEEKPETPELDTVELDKSVDSSFDNLFGKNGDDELKEGVTDTSSPFEKSSESFGHSSVSSLEMGAIVDLDLDEKSKASTLDVPAQESLTEEKPETPELDTVELDKSVDSSFDNLFGKNADDELSGDLTSDQSSETTLATESSVAEPAILDLDKSVDSSFENLFGKNTDDDLPLENLKLDDKSVESAPVAENTDALDLNKSVDRSFDKLFGKDSTDELLEDPTTSTRTLAEIYFGQGVYDEAIKIYMDLLRKSPDDEQLQNRLSEIEKIRNDKLNQD